MASVESSAFIKEGSYSLGCPCEVLSRDGKWYACKVVDTDVAMVKVHFDFWSSRFDEWISVTSERIRHPAASTVPIEEKIKYAVGDFVYAKWSRSDAKPFPAKIMDVDNFEESANLLFYDGFSKTVKLKYLKPMPSEDRNRISVSTFGQLTLLPAYPDVLLDPKSDKRLETKRRSTSVYARQERTDSSLSTCSSRETFPVDTALESDSATHNLNRGDSWSKKPEAQPEPLPVFGVVTVLSSKEQLQPLPQLKQQRKTDRRRLAKGISSGNIEKSADVDVNSVNSVTAAPVEMPEAVNKEVPGRIKRKASVTGESWTSPRISRKRPRIEKENNSQITEVSVANQNSSRSSFESKCAPFCLPVKAQGFAWYEVNETSDFSAVAPYKLGRRMLKSLSRRLLDRASSANSPKSDSLAHVTPDLFVLNLTQQTGRDEKNKQVAVSGPSEVIENKAVSSGVFINACLSTNSQGVLPAIEVSYTDEKGNFESLPSGSGYLVNDFNLDEGTLPIKKEQCEKEIYDRSVTVTSSSYHKGSAPKISSSSRINSWLKGREDWLSVEGDKVICIACKRSSLNTTWAHGLPLSRISDVATHELRAAHKVALSKFLREEFGLSSDDRSTEKEQTFTCPVDGCGKLFRSEKHLSAHTKHFHKSRASVLEAQADYDKSDTTDSSSTVVLVPQPKDATDIIRCKCQENSDTGLMVQCDVCHTWQHSKCIKMTADDAADKVPYVCYLCKHPPGARTIQRDTCASLKNVISAGMLPTLSGSSRPDAKLTHVHRAPIMQETVKTMEHIASVISRLNCMDRNLNLAKQRDEVRGGKLGRRRKRKESLLVKGLKKNGKVAKNLAEQWRPRYSTLRTLLLNDSLYCNVSSGQAAVAGDLDEIEKQIASLETCWGQFGYLQGDASLSELRRRTETFVKDLKRFETLTEL